MTLSPALRKTALTLHVASSVGWLGAVAAFLVLAIRALTADELTIYPTLGVLTWQLIIPLSLAALVTGVVSAVTTPWGLLRHGWVIAKLVLTAGATLLLFVHTIPIGQVASAPAEATRHQRIQLVADSALALVVLLVNTALGVFKPRRREKAGSVPDETARP